MNYKKLFLLSLTLLLANTCVTCILRASHAEDVEGVGAEETTAVTVADVPFFNSECSMCCGSLREPELSELSKLQSHKKNMVVVLACKHAFHESCLAEWRKVKDTCPICRDTVHISSTYPLAKNLTNIHFSGKTLANINFKKTDLSGARFERTDIRYSNFTDAILKHAHFERAFLSSIHFMQVSAENAVFSGAFLVNFQAQRAHCEFASFISTTFFYSDFRGTSFLNARMCYARSHFSTFDDCNFRHADCHGANFIRCSFKRACLANINLTNADLSYANFEDADFTNANLTGANFKQTFLRGACVKGARFDSVHGLNASQVADLLARGAASVTIADTPWIDSVKNKSFDTKEKDFRFLQLSDVKFSGKELTDVDFFYAKLDCPEFIESDLKHVNFAEAVLTRPTFSSAHFTDVKFNNSYLSFADFSNAKFYSVHFKKARLIGNTKFIDAEFNNVVFFKTCLYGAQFAHSHLSDVILRQADLGHADFSDAYLTNVDLSEANLLFADFSRAHLHNVNVTDARFDYVEVNGAVFEHVRGLSPETIALLKRRGAIFIKDVEHLGVVTATGASVAASSIELGSGHATCCLVM